jgi:hypothetical protein
LKKLLVVASRMLRARTPAMLTHRMKIIMLHPTSCCATSCCTACYIMLHPTSCCTDCTQHWRRRASLRPHDCPQPEKLTGRGHLTLKTHNESRHDLPDLCLLVFKGVVVFYFSRKAPWLCSLCCCCWCCLFNYNKMKI